MQGYPFPLSITMIHLIVKFLLAWIIRKIWSCISRKPPLVLEWKDYLKNIVPVGELLVESYVICMLVIAKLMVTQVVVVLGIYVHACTVEVAYSSDVCVCVFCMQDVHNFCLEGPISTISTFFCS